MQTMLSERIESLGRLIESVGGDTAVDSLIGALEQVVDAFVTPSELWRASAVHHEQIGDLAKTDALRKDASDVMVSARAFHDQLDRAIKAGYVEPLRSSRIPMAALDAIAKGTGTLSSFSGFLRFVQKNKRWFSELFDKLDSSVDARVRVDFKRALRRLASALTR